MQHRRMGVCRSQRRPEGLVTNLGIERTEAQHYRCLSTNPYNFAPPAYRFFSAFSMFVRGDQVASGVERIVYGGMDGEKSLSRAGGSEALHLSFSSSNRNMGAFDPDILPLGSMMPSREAEFTNGRGVGAQFVRDQRARCKTALCAL